MKSKYLMIISIMVGLMFTMVIFSSNVDTDSNNYQLNSNVEKKQSRKLPLNYINSNNGIKKMEKNIKIKNNEFTVNGNKINWIVYYCNNGIIKLNFNNYHIKYKNNNITISESNRYADIHNIITFGNKSINSFIIISSNIGGKFLVEYEYGNNNISRYKTMNISNKFYQATFDDQTLNWHNEYNKFNNGTLKYNNSSYNLKLYFKPVTLYKSEQYIIDPEIKPMRLPVEPCYTDLDFKLYDNTHTKFLIYSLNNEIITYGENVCFNSWYSVHSSNWHEVSCVSIKGKDYQKVQACFSGWFGTSWKSNVCSKIILGNGAFSGSIYNKIYELLPNIDQWALYSDKTVYNGNLESEIDNCYREYIIGD